MACCIRKELERRQEEVSSATNLEKGKVGSVPGWEENGAMAAITGVPTRSAVPARERLFKRLNSRSFVRGWVGYHAMNTRDLKVRQRVTVRSVEDFLYIISSVIIK